LKEVRRGPKEIIAVIGVLILGRGALCRCNVRSQRQDCKKATGDNNVGIIDASEDTEVDGPQALTADGKGDLYLLDQVNGRIIRFDPKHPTADSTILQLPDEVRPTDLVVRNSDILVWDGSVHSLQPAKGPDNAPTRGLEEVDTRAVDDQSVVSAFAQMGSEQPGNPAELLDPGVDQLGRALGRRHLLGSPAASVAVPLEEEAAAF